MAKVAILQIKKAEDKGNEEIKMAIERSKEIIKTAEDGGSQRQKEIIKDAYKEKDLLIEAAKNQVVMECKPFLKKGQEEIEKILNPVNDKLEKSINLVVERIVRGNGYS